MYEYTVVIKQATMYIKIYVSEDLRFLLQKVRSKFCLALKISIPEMELLMCTSRTCRKKDCSILIHFCSRDP